jgi:hypothetical protein
MKQGPEIQRTDGHPDLQHSDGVRTPKSAPTSVGKNGKNWPRPAKPEKGPAEKGPVPQRPGAPTLQKKQNPGCGTSRIH